MSNFAGRNVVTKLQDVVVPSQYYNRYLTRSEVLDHALGGEDSPGILPGGAYLLTGTPGAGKTTLAIQMAESYAATAKLKTVYNIGEESLFQVKMASDRIGVKGTFDVTSFADVNELLVYCIDNDVKVLFQDSLQSLSDITHPDLRSVALAETVAKKMTMVAKECSISQFIVGQVTKGGDFAGKNGLKHDVDAHIQMSISKDTGNRVLELSKNRFGPAQVPFEFTMTADGLNISRMTEQSKTEGPVVDGESRRSGKRTEALATVKKLLAAGMKLSGYSHEEVEELAKLNISGGYMRGILRVAANELAREGKKIKTEIVDRREHTFVEN